MAFFALFFSWIISTVSAQTIWINYWWQLTNWWTWAWLYGFNAYSVSNFSSLILYFGTWSTTWQVFSQNNVSLTWTIIPWSPNIYSWGTATFGWLSYSTTYRYFVRIIDVGAQILDSSLSSFTTTWDVVAGIFDTLDSTLTTNGIVNNLDTVDSTNITNMSGLYFEKVWYWKITFNTWLNLQDTGTQNFLQNLNSYLDMSNGFIWFNANASAEFKAKNAVLEMYFTTWALSYLSAITSSDVVVKSGSTIDPTALWSVTPPVSCTGKCILTLNANHFTTFDLKPKLTNVKIKSSNSTTSFAKSWDAVTLSFSWTESLTWVAVTISWISTVTVAGGWNSWTAYWTVPQNWYVWSASFTINYQDLSNNTWDTVTSTNDASSVSYTDSTAPVVSLNGSTPISIEINTVYTEAGATWTDNVDWNWTISTPTSWSVNTWVLWTYTLYYKKIDSSGNSWQVTRTVNVIADATAPTITLNWSNSIYIILGSSYTEQWARWTDAVDWSWVISTPTTWSVNTSVLWTYNLYYIKVDAAGNTGQAIRTVVVKTVNWWSSSSSSTSSKTWSVATWTVSTWSISTWTNNQSTTNDEHLWDISNSPYSDELNQAYLFAFRVGITTKNTIQEANMDWNLIRGHLAKMLVNYARYILGKNPDTTMKCEFNDMDDQTTEMKQYAVMACQLGIMWIGSDWKPANQFNPDLEVDRATFGTTLSRLLWWAKYNSIWDDRYESHLKALNTIDIMKNISNPNMKEIRWYVMLMLMRSRDI